MTILTDRRAALHAKLDALLEVEAWTCGYCGRRFPVTSLADWCQAKHEREAT